MVLERCTMVLAGQQEITQGLPRMDATFKATVHSAPEPEIIHNKFMLSNFFPIDSLDGLWRQIRSNDVVHIRSVHGIDELVQMVRHVAPQ